MILIPHAETLLASSATIAVMADGQVRTSFLSHIKEQ